MQTENKLSLPLSKDELLTHVEKMDYHQRIAYAARLGRDHKNSSQLLNLIDELRNHPLPDTPQMEIEEEFVKFLPSQEKNVGKYFHEDQIALTAAVASKNLPLLKEEINSPSLFFKRLAITEVVRQELEDDILFDIIKSAVQKIQKRLIHECIRRRRVAVLERLYPVLLEQHGPEVVADFLHGCSFELVTKQLEDKEIRSNKQINWHGMARHHGKAILELIRRRLEKNHCRPLKEWALQQVWNKWYTRLGGSIKELIHNTNLSGEILKLLDQYPCYSYIGTGFPPRLSECSPDLKVIVVPTIVSSHMSTFISKHPDHMLALCKSCIKLKKYDEMNCLTFGLSLSFWEGKESWGSLGKQRFEWVSSLIDHIFALSVPQSFYNDSHSAEILFISSGFCNKFMRHFSEHQILLFAKKIWDFLLTKRPNAKNFSEWSFPSKINLQNIIEIWCTKASLIYGNVLFELNRRLDRIALRENELKGGKAQGRKVLSKSKNINQGRGGGRRRRRYNDITPIISSSSSRPRVDKLTQEQTQQALETLEKRKVAVNCTRHEFLKTYAEALTTQWSWTREEYGFIDLKVKQQDIARKFHHSNLPFIQDDGDCLFIVFDKLFRFWTQEQLLSPFDEYYLIFEKYRDSLLSLLDKETKDVTKSKEYRTRCIQYRSQVFDYFFQFYSQQDAMTNSKTLIQTLMPCGLAQQRWAVYQLYTLENLNVIGQNNDDVLVSLFENILVVRNWNDSESIDFSQIYITINQLLDSEQCSLSENARDKLLGFQNIEDHAVRKLMAKTTDKNSIPEREAAYKALLTASRLSKSSTQMRRTLQFLRNKIKNESADNRQQVISILLNDVEVSNQVCDGPAAEYRDLILSEECLPLWNFILDDALASSDYREIENTVKSAFIRLSQAAISITAGTASTKDHASVSLFHFAIELQWRLCVFSLGLAKAYKKFRISLPSSLKPCQNNKYFPVGSELQLVDACVHAYSERVLHRNPHFFKKASTLQPLYPVVGKKWKDLLPLCEHMQRALAVLKEGNGGPPLRDGDGLLVIKQNHESVVLFEQVRALHDAYRGHNGEEWYDIPIMVEFVETLMRSRSAPKVFLPWLNMHSRGKTRAERKANRGKCVDTLLDISPSAIYLRPVWRFLVQYRQSKLDAFLNSKKTFRGVFFLDSSQREKGQVSKHIFKTKGMESDESDNIKQFIKNEKKKERGIAKEKLEYDELHMDDDDNNSIQFEHEDYFCLEACFGLHRLLPRQLEKLAAQRMDRILNADRALPARVIDTIRWTLLPIIDYNDIVVFYENHSKSKEQNELPVNILEAVLKGAMQSDEPCVPFQFLLSPKFLSSDRARIAMYCISRCVPYMPSHQMTEMLLMILSGKRRNSLKVTAYKEAIRLLAGRPTAKHMEMVLHEWKRTNVHRDVRIVILQMAFTFLIKKIGEDIAWEIIDSVLVDLKHNVEILTTLLGVLPKTTHKYRGMRAVNISKDLFAKPRLIQHYNLLAKIKIPDAHCERYYETIVKKLGTSTVEKDGIDDDVKHLAIFVSPMWMSHIPNVMEVIHLLVSVAGNVDPAILNDPKADMQKVHNNRFTLCIEEMNNIVRISHTFDGKEKEILETLSNLMDKLVSTSLTMSNQDREVRVNLYWRIKQLATKSLLGGGIYRRECMEKIELSLQKLDPMFSTEWINIQSHIIQSNSYSEFPVVGLPFVHSLLQHIEKYPSSEEHICYTIQQFVTNNCHSWNKEYKQRAYPFILGLLTLTLPTRISDDHTTSSSSSSSGVYTRCAREIGVALLTRQEYAGMFKSSMAERIHQTLMTMIEGNTSLLSNTNTNNALQEWQTEMETTLGDRIYNVIVTLCTKKKMKNLPGQFVLHKPVVKNLVRAIINRSLQHSENGHVEQEGGEKEKNQGDSPSNCMGTTFGGQVATYILQKLACSNASILVSVAPEHLCAIFHRLVNHLSFTGDHAACEKAATLGLALFDAIDQRSKDALNCQMKYQAEKDENNWSEEAFKAGFLLKKGQFHSYAALCFMHSILSSSSFEGSICCSDPLPIQSYDRNPYGDNTLDDLIITASFTPWHSLHPAYNSVMFYVGMKMLENHPYFLLQSKKNGIAFIHKAIARSVTHFENNPSWNVAKTKSLIHNQTKIAFGYITDSLIEVSNDSTISEKKEEEEKKKE